MKIQIPTYKDMIEIHPQFSLDNTALILPLFLLYKMSSILNSRSFNQVSSSFARSEDYHDLPTDRRNAISFFSEQLTKNIHQFADASERTYSKTVRIFERQEQQEIQSAKDSNKNGFEGRMKDNVERFEVFCLEKKQIDRKKQAIEEFARKILRANVLEKVFKGWRDQGKRQKRRIELQKRIEEYRAKRTIKVALKSWHDLTIQTMRERIKHNVLHRTNQQLTRIQSDYSSILQSLEQTLSSKLLELTKQQTEHRLLYRKYQQMMGRKPL